MKELYNFNSEENRVFNKLNFLTFFAFCYLLFYVFTLKTPLPSFIKAPVENINITMDLVSAIMISILSSRVFYSIVTLYPQKKVRKKNHKILNERIIKCKELLDEFLMESYREVKGNKKLEYNFKKTSKEILQDLDFLIGAHIFKEINFRENRASIEQSILLVISIINFELKSISNTPLQYINSHYIMNSDIILRCDLLILYREGKIKNFLENFGYDLYAIKSELTILNDYLLELNDKIAKIEKRGFL